MRRLYLQIYMAFLGILLLFGVLLSLTWFLAAPSAQGQRLLDGMGALLGELFPAPDRPVQELQARVAPLAYLFPAHLTVRAANGAVLAAVGEPLPAPPPHWSHSGWLRSGGAGPSVALLLPDGRWVVAHVQRPTPTIGWLVALGLLVVAIAIGAYPIARRLTRRLERLQRRVEALGAGELQARVEVEGHDEVADLARSFNRAADRIARLLTAQRSILAGASHELRSPLTRMRMAQEQERIFEPFYRPSGMVERSDSGVGLGLALVRQIARHHGGDVRCLPRPGGGTCFAVDLHSSP